MQPTQPTKGRRKLRAEKINVLQSESCRVNNVAICYNCHVIDGSLISRGDFAPQSPGVPAYKYFYSEDHEPDKKDYNVYSAINGQRLGHTAIVGFKGITFKFHSPITIKLILTYLDSNPKNEEDHNVRFLCQLCNARFTAVIRELRRNTKQVEAQKARQMTLKFKKEQPHG